MSVVTRFAPSPTGMPHLGTAMYALLNYLYAHQHDGKVLMRSEDTDPVRSKPEYEKAIIDGLKWLGIEADDFYRQSDRLDIYKKYIAKMIADGTAYVATDTNEKGETRDVVRFKNPNKVITFHDSSRGDISVDTTDLNDFIIARDVNSPLYHLTVVVDDHETGVTHIIRGEDGIANTARQILIQEAIGATRPVYAHYPFILLPNRTKMGKRNGAKSIQEYQEAGYLPEALINFVILMAWHPKDDRELFTIADLLKEFELERIGKSGAILDEKKLNWLNREYMLKMPMQNFIAYAKNFVSPDTAALLDSEKGLAIGALMMDRASTFGEIRDLDAAGEYSYFMKRPTITKEQLLWKGESADATRGRLEKVIVLLEPLDASQWSLESVKNSVWPYAETEGRGQVLWPTRIALSGKDKSPDPFTLAAIMGKDETLARLRSVVAVLAGA